MLRANWREHVASLLTEVGRALIDGNDRRAVVATGTALAYLEKASAQGDAAAGFLLAQLNRASDAESTARFRFTAGELEELTREEP